MHQAQQQSYSSTRQCLRFPPAEANTCVKNDQFVAFHRVYGEDNTGFRHAREHPKMEVVAARRQRIRYKSWRARAVIVIRWRIPEHSAAFNALTMPSFRFLAIQH